MCIVLAEKSSFWSTDFVTDSIDFFGDTLVSLLIPSWATVAEHKSDFIRFLGKEEIRSGDESKESEDRKATIVIEHLIQASDVAHTMQHWYIYKSWNEKFFCECYNAYKSGRANVDPSINWYTGEIGFFDFYVIPLAKKLDECGVFGVSSHEYLNYATANRDEWVREGEQLVRQFLGNCTKD